MSILARERSDCEGRSRDASVRRRHIIFVSGYDPRGAEEYHRLFERECERFRRERAIALTLHPLTLDSDDLAHWRVDMRAANWQVATHYDFLRLERFVRSDMSRPLAGHILRSLAWTIGDLVSGTQFRIFRASWRFGLHLLCCHSLVLAWLATAAATGVAIAYAAQKSLGFPVLADAAVSVVAAVAALLAMRPIVDRWFGIRITACWVTLRRFARARATWLDYMIDVCARRLIEVAEANDVDELVLVGHSTGGAIAPAALARALELDPDLGRRGPRVVLLTLGSVMPAVALHPLAKRMRAIIAKVVAESSVTWIDCQSRKDMMNFADFEPVEGIGIRTGAQQRNPLIWPVRFRDMVSPEYYRRFRWKFFRLHYQYIRAGDQPAPYDYVWLVAGPADIAEWATHPRVPTVPSLQHGAGFAAGRGCDPGADALVDGGGLMETT